MTCVIKYRGKKFNSFTEYQDYLKKVEGRTTPTKEQVRKKVEKILGNTVTIQEQNDLEELKGVYGQIEDSLITLSKNAPIGTAFHEAFHRVFRNMLTKSQVDALLKEALSLYSDADIAAKKEMLSKDPKLSKLTDEQFQELALEELLADTFKEYMLAVEELNNQPWFKNIPAKIKRFFDRLLNLIKFKSNPKSNVAAAQLFKYVDYGFFNKSPIVRASTGIAYMRKDIAIKNIQDSFEDADGNLSKENILLGVDAISSAFFAKAYEYIASGVSMGDIMLRTISTSANMLYEAAVEIQEKLVQQHTDNLINQAKKSFGKQFKNEPNKLSQIENYLVENRLVVENHVREKLASGDKIKLTILDTTFKINVQPFDVNWFFDADVVGDDVDLYINPNGFSLLANSLNSRGMPLFPSAVKELEVVKNLREDGFVDVDPKELLEHWQIDRTQVNVTQEYDESLKAFLNSIPAFDDKGQPKTAYNKSTIYLLAEPEEHYQTLLNDLGNSYDQIDMMQIIVNKANNGSALYTFLKEKVEADPKLLSSIYSNIGSKRKLDFFQNLRKSKKGESVTATFDNVTSVGLKETLVKAINEGISTFNQQFYNSILDKGEKATAQDVIRENARRMMLNAFGTSKKPLVRTGKEEGGKIFEFLGVGNTNMFKDLINELYRDIDPNDHSSNRIDRTIGNIISFYFKDKSELTEVQLSALESYEKHKDVYEYIQGLNLINKWVRSNSRTVDFFSHPAYKNFTESEKENIIKNAHDILTGVGINFPYYIFKNYMLASNNNTKAQGERTIVGDDSIIKPKGNEAPITLRNIMKEILLGNQNYITNNDYKEKMYLQKFFEDFSVNNSTYTHLTPDGEQYQEYDHGSNILNFLSQIRSRRGLKVWQNKYGKDKVLSKLSLFKTILDTAGKVSNEVVSFIGQNGFMQSANSGYYSSYQKVSDKSRHELILLGLLNGIYASDISNGVSKKMLHEMGNTLVPIPVPSDSPTQILASLDNSVHDNIIINRNGEESFDYNNGRHRLSATASMLKYEFERLFGEIKEGATISDYKAMYERLQKQTAMKKTDMTIDAEGNIVFNSMIFGNKPVKFSAELINDLRDFSTFGTTEEYNAFVERVATSNVNAVVGEMMQEFETELKTVGIIEAKQGTSQEYLDFVDLPMLKGYNSPHRYNETKDAIFFSWFLNYTQVSILTNGHASQYKSPGDMIKRGKQASSPRKSLNTEAQFEAADGKKFKVRKNYNVLVLEDVERESLQGGAIREHLKKLFNLLGKEEDFDAYDDPYSRSNLADGSTFIDPMRRKEIEIGTDNGSLKWNDEKEAAYRKMMSSKYEPNSISEVFGVLKPFYFGMKETEVRDEAGNVIETRIEPAQMKNSEFMISPFFALKQINGQPNPLYNPLYRKIMERMGYQFDADGRLLQVDGKEAWQYVEEKRMAEGNTLVDSAAFESAVKSGIIEKAKIEHTTKNDKGEIISESKHNDNVSITQGHGGREVLKLENTDYGIIQEVPQKVEKAKGTIAIQLRRNILSDLTALLKEGGNVEYNVNGKKLNPEELVSHVNKFYIEMLVDNIEAFERKLGIDKVNDLTINDEGRILARKTMLAKIIDIVRSQAAADGNLDSDLNQLLELDRNGNPSTSLGIPQLAIGIKMRLNALANKTVFNKKLKNGFSVPNVPAVGFAREPKIVFKKGADGKRSIENGVDYFEAFMTATNPMVHLIDENGYFNIEQDADGNFTGKSYTKLLKLLAKGLYGNDVDFNKLTDEQIATIKAEADKMFRGVGWRIPNEDKYSSVSFKVVGYLPREVGGAIVLPHDITEIAGLDFDIDKMFGYMYDFIFNTYKIKPVSKNKLNIKAARKLIKQDPKTKQKTTVLINAIKMLQAFNSQFYKLTKSLATSYKNRDSDLYTPIKEIIKANGEPEVESLINEIVESSYMIEKLLTEPMDSYSKGKDAIAKLHAKNINVLATLKREVFIANNESLQKLYDTYKVEKNEMIVDEYEKSDDNKVVMEINSIERKSAKHNPANRFLDYVRSVLENPNSIINQFLPGGFQLLTANNVKMDKARGIELSDRGSRVDRRSHYRIGEHVKAQSDVHGGGSLIGIAANAIAGKIIIDMMKDFKVVLKKPIKIAGETRKNLQSDSRQEKQNIVQLLAAFVDFVKDPQAVRSNINQKTITTGILLLFAGFDLKTVQSYLNNLMLRAYTSISEYFNKKILNDQNLYRIKMFPYNSFKTFLGKNDEASQLLAEYKDILQRFEKNAREASNDRDSSNEFLERFDENMLKHLGVAENIPFTSPITDRNSKERLEEELKALSEKFSYLIDQKVDNDNQRKKFKELFDPNNRHDLHKTLFKYHIQEFDSLKSIGGALNNLIAATKVSEKGLSAIDGDNVRISQALDPNNWNDEIEITNEAGNDVNFITNSQVADPQSIKDQDTYNNAYNQAFYYVHKMVADALNTHDILSGKFKELANEIKQYQSTSLSKLENNKILRHVESSTLTLNNSKFNLTSIVDRHKNMTTLELLPDIIQRMFSNMDRFKSMSNDLLTPFKKMFEVLESNEHGGAKHLTKTLIYNEIDKTAATSGRQKDTWNSMLKNENQISPAMYRRFLDTVKYFNGILNKSNIIKDNNGNPVPINLLSNFKNNVKHYKDNPDLFKEHVLGLIQNIAAIRNAVGDVTSYDRIIDEVISSLNNSGVMPEVVIPIYFLNSTSKDSTRNPVKKIGNDYSSALLSSSFNTGRRFYETQVAAKEAHDQLLENMLSYYEDIGFEVHRGNNNFAHSLSISYTNLADVIGKYSILKDGMSTTDKSFSNKLPSEFYKMYQDSFKEAYDQNDQVTAGFGLPTDSAEYDFLTQGTPFQDVEFSTAGEMTIDQLKEMYIRNYYRSLRLIPNLMQGVSEKLKFKSLFYNYDSENGTFTNNMNHLSDEALVTLINDGVKILNISRLKDDDPIKKRYGKEGGNGFYMIGEPGNKKIYFLVNNDNRFKLGKTSNKMRATSEYVDYVTVRLDNHNLLMKKIGENYYLINGLGGHITYGADLNKNLNEVSLSKDRYGKTSNVTYDPNSKVRGANTEVQMLSPVAFLRKFEEKNGTQGIELNVNNHITNPYAAILATAGREKRDLVIETLNSKSSSAGTEAKSRENQVSEVVDVPCYS